jgi:acetoin utilization deacetylase AcuC-like enzyme
MFNAQAVRINGVLGGRLPFNGLMVAAIDAIQSDAVDAVWIVDCDYHYGDGTDHILATLPKALRKRIHHFTAGKKLHRPEQANAAISFAHDAAICAKRGATSPEEMGIKMDHKRKLVLYQAGADQHIDDPLGGILTTEQLMQRDHDFFRIIGMYGIPCAWNLAGGYQQEPDGSIPKVLEVHRNTMKTVLETM